MSGWGCCLTLLGLLFVGALLLTVAVEYYVGSGVYAEYPQGVAFSGGGHFLRMTYYGVAWVRDGQNPRPCPLSIHLANGDITAAEFAMPDALLARGWTKLTNDEQLATGLPQILQYREGDYAAQISYANPGGEVTAVTVGCNSVASARPDARGIAIGFQGVRVSLPVSEEELIRALGTPVRRTRATAY